MAYTLWQGERNLGELVFEYPNTSDGMIAGLFRPAPDFVECEPTVQSRLELAPGRPVIRDVPVPACPEGIPLRRLSEKEPAGLPFEEQWILRDSAGDPVDVEFLSISRETVPPGTGPMPDVCRAHGFHDCIWVLMAH